MKIDMATQDKAFLKLAAKDASGQATSDEQFALEKLLQDHPRYRREFRELMRELQKDSDLGIFALRVVLGKASPNEVKKIKALKQSAPEQWNEYQDAVNFLKDIASQKESTKSTKIQPMPEHVRKELQAKLKDAREKANLRSRRPPSK